MSIIRELEIGPDKVHLIGNEVTIFAKHAMADWTVREFCRVPIYFNDNKYYLLRKTPGPHPYAFQYFLAPWHAELGPESTRTITYDEAYVAHRDGRIRGDRRDERLFPVLVCLYPLLGICWSRFKTQVLGPRGFEPASVTGASIMLLFAFWMLESVFVLYFHVGFLVLLCSRIWVLWIDRLLFLLLPLDCAIRYGKLLEGEESPPGFLEWAWRLVSRKA